MRGKGVIGQVNTKNIYLIFLFIKATLMCLILFIKEPYLNSDHPVFQYSSHVNLQSPSGSMWGTFKMEKDDGTFFEVKIPTFYLDCKDEDKPLTA